LRSPDPWQIDMLSALVTREEDTQCLCSRQSGKTEANALAAYVEAANGGFVLILTPSDEQSKEFMERVASHHNALRLANPVDEPTKHEIKFAGEGRIKALPNNERTARIYARVSLIIIDEASRVPDQLYGAVTPMLMVSRASGLGGRIGLLSTPFGKRGFFYEEWIAGRYKRFRAPWTECPRIKPEDVELERKRHGDLWVQQEYELAFLDQVQGGFFDADAFAECIIPDTEFQW